MLWSFTMSQMYDVRIKDNHENLKKKNWVRIEQWYRVNSQLSSNKLFSIDFLIPIKSRYDSCIHIAFFVRAFISNLFFFYFLSLSSRFLFGSSFNHLSIIIIVRSFVQSISTLGRLNSMLKSCTTIAHAFTMEIIRYACMNMM